MLHKCSGPIGKANYDGHFAPGFAAAGIHSCVDQSFAGLRLAHKLDRTRYCSGSKEPPRSSRDINACIYQFHLGLAGLRIRRAGI